MDEPQFLTMIEKIMEYRREYDEWAHSRTPTDDEIRRKKKELAKKYGIPERVSSGVGNNGGTTSRDVAV